MNNDANDVPSAWEQPLTETGDYAIHDRYSDEERLSVIYTLKCNINCAHCMTVSSPKRREKLTPEEVLEYLRAGAKRGKKLVTFTGGEVFLYFEDLLYLTSEASALGYEVDVGTNAFWAPTIAKAIDRIAPLKAAGLKGLSLSVDAHHAAFFPTERVINAYRAACELGLQTEVNFCPSADRVLDQDILDSLQAEKVPVLTHLLLNRGYGRDGLVVFPKNHVSQLPDCGSQKQTLHPLGDVFACCELEDDNPTLRQTPVYLGNIKDGAERMFDQLERAKMMHDFYDPDSPAYFRKLMETEESFRNLQSRRFHSICDFCMAALTDPARVETLRKTSLVQITR